MNNQEAIQKQMTRREVLGMLGPAIVGVPLVLGSMTALRKLNPPEEVEARQRKIEEQMVQCPEDLVCEPKMTGGWEDAAATVGLFAGWGLTLASGVLVFDSLKRQDGVVLPNDPKRVDGPHVTSIEELKATFPAGTPVTVEATPIRFKLVDETTRKTTWHHGVDVVARAGDEVVGWHRETVTSWDPKWNPNSDVARRRDEIQNLLTAEESLAPFRDMNGVTTAVKGLNEEALEALHQEAQARHITAHWRHQAS